jgi:CheY-like chemotaxis protein
MYEDYRVLFVDDEPNILNSLRRGLADEEFFCHFANSGKEALEIINSNTIAVIVTDMRMPEMTGLELLNLVSALSPMTVKVVLSGYTQLQQILVTINQVDIFKFVTKPWELSDFIQVIRKSLDYYILQEQNINYKKTLEAKNTSYQNILKKINEMVDDAKFSKVLLGVCGKAIVAYDADFSATEKIALQSVLSSRTALFDIMVEKLTTQKKEMGADKLSAYLSQYLKRADPECTVDTENSEPVKLTVNLKMMEAAIDAIRSIFSDEFARSGMYCKCKAGDPFTLVLISLKVESERADNTPVKPTLLDAKMALARTALYKVLELSGIQFQIVKSEGSMIAEIQVRQEGESNHEKNTNR